MSDSQGSDEIKVKLTIRQKVQKLWHDFWSDPKIIVRTAVLIICTVVVVFQLSECFFKLFHPPITTHSLLDLNDTMSYPAVTFCRDPPYKEDVLRTYNLSFHPRLSSEFRRFAFDTTNLDDVFRESTYGPDEYFIQYALDGFPENIQIVSTLNFELGQCQTLVPLVNTKGVWKDSGYSLILKHHIDSIEQSTSEIPPGWHVYIHEPKEKFAENNMDTCGRVEYMYINANEEVEIKFTANNFEMMASRDNHCSYDPDHSFIQCSEFCKWKNATGSVNCSGPWMPTIDLPYCNNFTLMRNLISDYLAEFDLHDCECINPCHYIVYNAYIMNRIEFKNQPTPSSQVWMYYTSKMITINKERPGYGLSQFVADMGGSLGFLLGLSVLGVIGLLEKITVMLFVDDIAKNKAISSDSDKIKSKVENYSDICSDTTLELPDTQKRIDQ